MTRLSRRYRSLAASSHCLAARGAKTHCPVLREMGTMRAFPLRSGDGEEKTSSNSSVVGGGCEKLKGFRESEALGASGGEEAASDARRRSAEGNGARCEVQVDKSEAQRLRVREAR
jgi:hypothetical protein